MDYTELKNPVEYYTYAQDIYVSYFLDMQYDSKTVDLSYKTTKSNCFPQFMTLVKCKEFILLIPSIDHTGIHSIQFIDRKNFEIESLTREEVISKYGYFRVELSKAVTSLFGMYRPEKGNNIQIVLIECVDYCCNLKNHEIFKIKSTDVFDVEKGEFDIQISKMYTTVLSKNFVFSITRNMSRGFDCHDSKKHQCSYNYTWNQELFKDLIEKGQNDWVIPVIQGGLYKIKYNINQKRYELTYKIKRSVFRGGIKPYIAGLNNIGYTSNYIKHDILIESDDLKLSFKFSSGDIPFQVQEHQDMKEVYYLRKSKEKNRMAFRTHLQLLNRNNEREMMFIGTVANEPKNSEKLSSFYKYEVAKIPKNINVNFKNFEFNELISVTSVKQLEQTFCALPTSMWTCCKYIGFNLSKLQNNLEKSEDSLENQSREIDYKNDMNKILGNCISRQTNKLHITSFCEKSSVALQRYMLYIVYSAMNEATFKVDKWDQNKTSEYIIYEASNFPWVEISRFTTKIVFDIQTMSSPSMDSIEYMPQNSREELFDEIPSFTLGDINYNKKYFDYSKVLKLKTEYDPDQQRELLGEIQDKNDWEISMNVQVITYNVSGYVPKDKEEIKKLLFPKSNHPICKLDFEKIPCKLDLKNKGISDEQSLTASDLRMINNPDYGQFKEFATVHDEKNPNFKPDIIAIGLQEVVELKAGKMFMQLFKEDGDKAWAKIVQEVLDEVSGNYQKDQYKLIEKKLQVGTQSLIFVKKSFKNSISSFHTEEVKFGLNGIYGNKGVQISSMMVHDSRIAFCACHLPSGTGEKKSDSRIEHIRSTMNDLKKKLHYDFVFFYGDLNIRTTLNKEESDYYAPNLLQDDADAFDYFHERDELLPNQLNLHLIEPKIRFRPTYRYLRKLGSYCGKRIPAWTDRIQLYVCGDHKGAKLLLHDYNHIEMKVSDHMPVYAKYTIKAKNLQYDKLMIKFQDNMNAKWQNINTKTRLNKVMMKDEAGLNLLKKPNKPKSIPYKDIDQNMPSDHQNEMPHERREKYSIFENTNENEKEDENDKNKDYEMTKREVFAQKVDGTSNPLKRGVEIYHIEEQNVIDDSGNVKVSYITK